MKQGRRCYTPGPRHQRRMRARTSCCCGASLQATDGILVRTGHRNATSAVSASPALGPEPHKPQARPSPRPPELRAEAQPGHQFIGHRILFDVLRAPNRGRSRVLTDIENTSISRRLSERIPRRSPRGRQLPPQSPNGPGRQLRGPATAMQACGPRRPQAPSTKSRPDDTVLQDDPRGVSTAARPS